MLSTAACPVSAGVVPTAACPVPVLSTAASLSVHWTESVPVLSTAACPVPVLSTAACPVRACVVYGRLSRAAWTFRVSQFSQALDKKTDEH